MAHRSFLLKGECNHSAGGFRGISSDFNLTHRDEIHIYFFSLVYFKKNKNKNKTPTYFISQSIRFLLSNIHYYLEA